ncbi:MAG TPA: DUF4390 domain-containing protein [Thermoanaerobaculia bacterium]|nr:DUF4390 domain-containing protein [Thermoanaerobaculia bacterium]
MKFAHALPALLAALLAAVLLSAGAPLAASAAQPGSAAAADPPAGETGPAATGPPEIQDLRVRVDGNLARLSFTLAGGFSPRLMERLESGLPTGFTYRLELLKDRKRWFDRGLETNTFQVVAMYDAATRGYLVNYKLDGKLVESRMVRDRADLERTMTRVEELPAFTLDELPRTWRLLVRVRAEEGAGSLPAFLPTRSLTDWRESRKFHSLNDLPDRS